LGSKYRGIVLKHVKTINQEGKYLELKESNHLDAFYHQDHYKREREYDTFNEPKQCFKCKENKSIEQFHKKGKRLDSWCKNCRNKKRKNVYQKKKKKDRIVSSFSISFESFFDKRKFVEKLEPVIVSL